MGWLKALGKCAEAVADVAIVPVDVARDFIEIGENEGDSHTGQRLRKIVEDLEEAHDETKG